jgi:hypothetical protein
MVMVTQVVVACEKKLVILKNKILIFGFIFSCG